MQENLSQVVATNWLDRTAGVQLHEQDLTAADAPIELVYGFGSAWFGDFVAAISSKGLAWLEPEFGVTADVEPEQRIVARWTSASLNRDDALVSQWLERALHDGPLPLHLCGTPFQLQVWRCLLDIPLGSVVSYGSLATTIGKPAAARAVGAALGANRIALFVPCHRVLPASGSIVGSIVSSIGGFRWGEEFKRELLEIEQCAATEVA